MGISIHNVFYTRTDEVFLSEYPISWIHWNEITQDFVCKILVPGFYMSFAYCNVYLSLKIKGLKRCIFTKSKRLLLVVVGVVHRHQLDTV